MLRELDDKPRRRACRSPADPYIKPVWRRRADEGSACILNKVKDKGLRAVLGSWVLHLDFHLLNCSRCFYCPNFYFTLVLPHVKHCTTDAIQDLVLSAMKESREHKLHWDACAAMHCDRGESDEVYDEAAHDEYRYFRKDQTGKRSIIGDSRRTFFLELKWGKLTIGYSRKGGCWWVLWITKPTSSKAEREERL